MSFLNKYTVTSTFAIFLVIACPVHGNETLEQISLDQTCSFFGEVLPDKVYTFSSDNAAEKVIEKVVKTTGLPKNFTVVAAGVPNAAAVVRNGKRYILYNQSFLYDIKEITENDWAAYTIMAHEVGHHLAGHTLDKLGSRPATELEADKYSGFVLQRLGASLEDAQLAIQLIADENESLTHPAKHDRLAAIANGWLEECDRDARCNRSSSSPSIRAKQRGRESSSIKTEQARLTVNVLPRNARVRIMNISPKYKPGIQLLKGNKYHIVVDESGYEKFDKWITLQETDVSFDVNLTQKPKEPAKVQKGRNSDPTPTTNFANCASAVQDNIAWNYQGTKRWNLSSLRALCGKFRSIEPARCFSAVMHDGVDWGGGTQWRWENAVNLCARTQNAEKTVLCFIDKVAQGIHWQHAVNGCRRG